MRRLGALTAQLGRGPMPVLLGLSGAAFVAVALLPSTTGLAALCGQIGAGGLRHLAETWTLYWSPWNLLLDWSLMVVAMMAPLVALTLSHVWRSSLPTRRPFTATACLVGYLLSWIAAGAVLIPLQLSAAAILPPRSDVLILAGLASIWSASPVAQSARNRCHRMRRIGVFGARAYLDPLRQGIETGGACLVACWPWMLVAGSVASGHLYAMAAVAIYLFAERIAPPASVGWRVPPAWETLAGLQSLRLIGRFGVVRQAANALPGGSPAKTLRKQVS